MRLPLALCGLLIVITGCVAVADTPPSSTVAFTMNGWQFHDYNMPKLEEAVRKAPRYGVNFLIFSHDFFRSVEGFLASTDDADPAHPPAHIGELKTGEYFKIIPGWQRDLNHIGDLATAEHIPYYLWVHEFDDIPKRFFKDGKINMDDPALFDYLNDRYEKLLAAVPGTAGFVLTLHESDFKVFRNTDVLSVDDVPTRIVRVARLLHDILKRHGKQLILRNFFYEPQEMEYFKEALPRLPDDIIVMSKDMTHEFDPFYPFDPLHGNVGNKRQIIEIDLGVEKAWSDQGAYAQPAFIRSVVQRARDKGVIGIVGRCRLMWDHPFEDMHEVNLYAFSRFMRDPDLSVSSVLQDWAALHYPAEAAPFIASALARSEFINHHGRWHLGMWFTKAIGAEWGDYPYYFGHPLERSRFKWTHDPADQALEFKLYHPDETTYAKLLAEKDEVVAQVAASMDDLRQASRYLTPEQFAPLHDDFAFLQDAALLQREWIRAYFAMRLYMEGDKGDPKYVVWMEQALSNLEHEEKFPGITWGLNVETGRRYNIDKFELEMRWRVANRARALEEDKQILEEVRKEGEVDER